MKPVFRGAPCSLTPEELSRILEANPGILGDGWEYLGRGYAAEGEPARILLATPQRALVLCMIAPVVDTALLSRGLSLLGGARQALTFLANFQWRHWPGLEKARLLLLGSRVEKEVLTTAGPEVSILLAFQVNSQPGPPLVLVHPPFQEKSPYSAGKGAPSRQSRPEEEALPSPGAPSLEDDEVARLIS